MILDDFLDSIQWEVWTIRKVLWVDARAILFSIYRKIIHDPKLKITIASQWNWYSKNKLDYLTIVYQLTFLLDSKDANWYKISHDKLFERQQSTANAKASRQIHQLLYKALMFSLKAMKNYRNMHLFYLTWFFEERFLDPQQKTSPEIHRLDISCHT